MPIEATPNPIINVPEPTVNSSGQENNEMAERIVSPYYRFTTKDGIVLTTEPLPIEDPQSPKDQEQQIRDAIERQKMVDRFEEGKIFSSNDASGLAVSVNEKSLEGLSDEDSLRLKMNSEMLMNLITKYYESSITNSTSGSSFVEKYYSPENLLFIARQISYLNKVSSEVVDNQDANFQVTFQILPGGRLSNFSFDEQELLLNKFEDSSATISDLLREVATLAKNNYTGQFMDYLSTIEKIGQISQNEKGILGSDLKARYEDLRTKALAGEIENLDDSLLSPDYANFMESFIAKVPDDATSEELINSFNEHLFTNIPYSTAYLRGEDAKRQIGEIKNKKEEFMIRAIKLKSEKPPLFSYVSDSMESLEGGIELAKLVNGLPRLNVLITAQENSYKYSFTNVENITDPYLNDAMLCWNYSWVMHHFLDEFLETPSTIIGFINRKDSNLGHAVNLFVLNGEVAIVNPTWGIGVDLVTNHLSESMKDYTLGGIYLPAPNMGSVNDLSINPESVALIAMLQRSEQLQAKLSY